jgi:hypothetical protein
MERKICKTCEIEKSFSQYYSCKNCIGGIQGSCKLCISNKRVTKKLAEGKIHPFNKEFRKSEDAHFSMAGATKEHYMIMWEILAKMGYDLEKDVAQQFLDKFNVYEKKPMKYKKRKHGFESYILPNGEVNPISKSERYKKTPTEE